MSGSNGYNTMKSDGTSGPATRGTVVVDLDGVVYVGSQGVAGARQALTDLENGGWHLVFATNNSTKTPHEVENHIEQRTGFRSYDARVVTSSQAAANWTAREHRSAFVVGERAISAALENVGVDVVSDGPCDSVVVGLDRNITYEKIATAARLIRSGATFVATNIDVTIPSPEGLDPGAGSIVAAVTAASGTAPISCGKPAAPMLDLVKDAIRGTEVWVVGDRPETDIAMAAAAGWRSVLVHTGVTEAGARNDGQHVPTHSVGSIGDVPTLIT